MDFLKLLIENYLFNLLKFNISKSLIEGILINIISAIFIFFFIWLFRKRPRITAEGTLLVSARPAEKYKLGDSLVFRRNFNCEIKIILENESSFDAYRFKIYGLAFDYKDSSIIFFPETFKTIHGNSYKTAIIQFAIKKTLNVSELSMGVNYIYSNLKNNLFILCKYENEERRSFNKKIHVNITNLKR